MTNDPRPVDPWAPAPPDRPLASGTHDSIAPTPRDPFAPAPPDARTTAVPVSGTSASMSPDPFDRPAMGPVGAPTVRARSKGSGMLVNVLLGIAVVIAVGGVAFAVGRATAPTAVAAANNGRFGNGGFLGPNASGAPGGGFVGNGGLGGFGGASIEGTVTAISADSITLQLASGQTVTIPIDAQTTFHQRASATASDVTTGSTVIVQVQGGRGFFNGNGNGNGNGGGPSASGQPTRTLPAASSITLAPKGS